VSSLVIDAAYPPPAIPAGVAGVMGYIGGAAAHVWTPKEWQPFAAARQFPIWVAVLGSPDPAEQALEAVDAARRLGWAPGPQDARVIVCDLETAVVPGWYAAWAAEVLHGGFAPVCYGSSSTVFANEAADVISADWDGVKVIPAGQTLHGVQYAADVRLGASSSLVDYSVFDSWLMARGGVGPRHGA
jgi:hypothetical protein